MIYFTQHIYRHTILSMLPAMVTHINFAAHRNADFTFPHTQIEECMLFASICPHTKTQMMSTTNTAIPEHICECVCVCLCVRIYANVV